MSTHQLPIQLHSAPFETLDPGSGAAIRVDRWNQVVPLTIAASTSETNTLAAPLKAGQRVTIFAASVGSSGSRAVTVASAYDAAGGTVLTFDAVDERVVLESIPVGSGVFEWRVVDFEGVTGPTTQIGGGTLDVTTLKIGGVTVTSSAAELNIVDGVTATAAEINAAADVSGRLVNVTDAASYTVLAADSGKPHIIPNFTATCTIALPAAASGLEYEFISKAIAADAQDWKIQSPGNFLGGVLFLDTDDPADTVIAVFPNGSSNDFLNVVTPSGGTRLKFVCDGTNWIAGGIVVSATTPAFADT